MVVRDRELGGGGVEAFYTPRPVPAAALQAGLHPITREARRLEALGHARRGGGQKFFLKTAAFEDVDMEGVAALCEVMPAEAPGWVAAVRDMAADKGLCNPYLIAGFTGLPMQVVVAGLALLWNPASRYRDEVTA